MASTVSVDVTFEVDINGILHVSATHKVMQKDAFGILKNIE